MKAELPFKQLNDTQKENLKEQCVTIAKIDSEILRFIITDKAQENTVPGRITVLNKYKDQLDKEGLSDAIAELYDYFSVFAPTISDNIKEDSLLSKYFQLEVFQEVFEIGKKVLEEVSLTHEIPVKVSKTVETFSDKTGSNKRSLVQEPQSGATGKINNENSKFPRHLPKDYRDPQDRNVLLNNGKKSGGPNSLGV